MFKQSLTFITVFLLAILSSCAGSNNNLKKNFLTENDIRETLSKNELELNYLINDKNKEYLISSLLESGYKRAGFESYALPEDVLSKSIDKGEAYYNSLGTQKGEVTNFVAVGSSAHGCLGNEYYFQNFYEQNLYREAIDRNEFPIYRGMKLTEDDKIRQYIVKTIRTYFKIEYEEVNLKYKVTFIVFNS